MRYILLGTLSTEWAAKHGQRVARFPDKLQVRGNRAKAKLEELGITLEKVYYTQGQFDFVDVVDAPEPDALLTFSLWYVTQGYGRIQSILSGTRLPV